MLKSATRSLVFVVVSLAAGSASAKVPSFSAKCPGDVTVETDRAGRAYIGGKKATVRTKNANFSEISIPGFAVDVANDGGNLIVTYTGRNRANGICQVVEHEKVESAPPSAKPAGRAVIADDVPLRDKKACLRAVQRTTNNRQATVLGAISSEANNTVTIGVGPQKAPWRCLVKHGVVADVMSQTDEGAL